MTNPWGPETELSVENNPSTKTLNDVFEYVKRQFGDESGVQLVEDDVIRWTNLAQLEIVSKTTMLQATAYANLAASTSPIQAPKDTIQIEMVTWSGRTLKAIDMTGAINHMGVDGAFGDPIYWTFWANSIYIVPVPTVAGDLWIYYIAQPANVLTKTDLLSIPDRYFDKVLMFVMSKAYEMDQDWPGHTAQRQQFETEIASMQLAERNAQGSNLSIRDVDEDLY